MPHGHRTESSAPWMPPTARARTRAPASISSGRLRGRWHVPRISETGHWPSLALPSSHRWRDAAALSRPCPQAVGFRARVALAEVSRSLDPLGYLPPAPDSVRHPPDTLTALSREETARGRALKPSPLVSAPTRSCRRKLEQSQGLPVKRPDAEPDDDVHQGHDESHAPPRPQVHVAGPKIDRGRAATVVGQGDAEIREERQAEGREIGWCPAAATATVRNGTNRAVTWAVRPAKK